jgi:hypothetical protein
MKECILNIVKKRAAHSAVVIQNIIMEVTGNAGESGRMQLHI